MMIGTAYEPFANRLHSFSVRGVEDAQLQANLISSRGTVHIGFLETQVCCED